MKSVPRRKELMVPVMSALNKLGGSASVREIDDEVVEQLQIPENIANIPHRKTGNQTRLRSRLGWARTFLKRAGFLENPRSGVWAIKPGQQEREVNPEEIESTYLRNLRSQRKEAAQNDRQELEDEITPDSEDESWHDELFTVLTETLRPDAFERLAKRLLHECGFVEVKVTGKAGDGGIDGTGIAKVNELMSFHVLFQCKRYKNAVAAGAIRDFRGAMSGRTDKGLFITTSTFTRDARKEATRDGVPPIDLIDGEQLMEKLKEFRLGIEVETVEKVSINKNWYQNI
ncbi:MAG: Restriction endonuclease [Arenicellales bacterium IbO2]|nr:restriction endonuclease [Alphaproteobacteria bacterium]CAJ2377292.1 MAG: Restriction endonuclease [Arenicellales bacterium IbO2]